MGDRIQDILKHKSSDVWCIAEEATIAKAAHRMRAHGIGTLIVVGRDRAVGMLSEHDIVFGVVASGEDPNVVRVSTIMTAVPIVSLETTIEAAAELAAAKGAHQIVVIDEERIVGVVSAKEMSSWVNLGRSFEISDLMGYITGRAAPPRATSSVSLDEAPIMEANCAYCGAEDDDASWDLGVALCRTCASPDPTRWSPYRA